MSVIIQSIILLINFNMGFMRVVSYLYDGTIRFILKLFQLLSGEYSTSTSLIAFELS